MVQRFEIIRGDTLSRKRSPILKQMASMECGDSAVHDHSGYITSMSQWIAQQKFRMKKSFKYERIDPKQEIYLITFVSDIK